MAIGQTAALGVKNWREAGRQVMAGGVTSVVAVAYCLSFSALIFAGELRVGLPAALWGFLVATAAVTLLAGRVTSLPPMLAGPRNPAVAVMSVLAVTIANEAASHGLSGAEVARHVLVALAIATVLTGTATWAIGHFRLGQIVRFVPYPVVAGFLAASGWLLIVGGLRVARGQPITITDFAGLLEAGEALRLGLAVMLAGGLLALRRSRLGAGSLPVGIIVASVLLDVGLWQSGQPGGWFLPTNGGAAAWSPWTSLGGIDWRLIASAGVEILSIVAVSLVGLLLDITTIEVQRRGAADMDEEFRAIGAANLAVASVGGLSVGYSIGPSRLIDALGGGSRLSGLAAGLGVAVAIASGLDLAQLVPRPVLGGLLIFLGAGLLMEALKAPGRRSWLELGLSVIILAAIVTLGYPTGIVLGMVGACLMFAASYSRIGVLRRHVTRQAYAAPVERSPEELQRLSEDGWRVHVLWLAGFVFFGSSNALYEEIRRVVGGDTSGRVRWVVLDCGRVIGIDASAILSLQKLVNWAQAERIVLVFASASEALLAELAAAGVAGERQMARVFVTRNDALEWCENELLRDVGAVSSMADKDRAFDEWLGLELGPEAGKRLIAGYLERHLLDTGEVVCALGAPADTIELVAHGSVSVMVPGLGSQPIRVRRMTGLTVVGEMGFFRELPRAASVMAEEKAVVYRMTRAAYRRLLEEDSALAARFLELIVRSLANRVDVANREITALV
ncbi:MAG: SulP family inorganic anion transporter [Hyphomicrobiaceae bacterium]